jgi:hypothetical protein
VIANTPTFSRWGVSGRASDEIKSEMDAKLRDVRPEFDRICASAVAPRQARVTT